MSDPVDDLPREIQGHIRILLRRAAGGGARYQKSGDRSGLEAQKAISEALQAAEIYETDPRWEATIKIWPPALPRQGHARPKAGWLAASSGSPPSPHFGDGCGRARWVGVVFEEAGEQRGFRARR
jgi:hypothetical protein